MNLSNGSVLLTVCVAAVLSLSGCASATYSETCKSSDDKYDKLQAYTACEIDESKSALAEEIGLNALLVPLPELDDSIIGLGELGSSCLVAVADDGEGSYLAIIQSRFDASIDVAWPSRLSESQLSSLMDDYRLNLDCNQLSTL